MHIIKNDPDDPFSSSEKLSSESVRGLAVGLLNDDDIPDLVTLDAERYLIRTYFGNMRSAESEGDLFTLQQDEFALQRDNPYSLTLADVDGVNGLDIVTGGRLGQIRAYLNDGTGHYQKHRNN